jgi:hypothetical protein
MAAPAPTIQLNMSKMCRLTGGTIDPSNPTLCRLSTALAPDAQSCYAGPNQETWVGGADGRCVSNLAVACTALRTFERWYMEGDDVVCRYGGNVEDCSGVAAPAVAPTAPTAPAVPAKPAGPTAAPSTSPGST